MRPRRRTRTGADRTPGLDAFVHGRLRGGDPDPRHPARLRGALCARRPAQGHRPDAMRRPPRRLDRLPTGLRSMIVAGPLRRPRALSARSLSMAIASGIFRQYDIRGIVGADLTTEVARAHRRRLRGAPARSAASRGAVAVGRDNRPSGDALRDALVDGLTSAGVDVVDIGVVPTPLLYWSLHHLRVVGGIQITGSHNPARVQRLQAVASAPSRCTATTSSICSRSSGGAAPTAGGGHGAPRAGDRPLRRRRRRAHRPALASR